MKTKKRINLIVFCLICVVSILPIVLFWDNIGITKYSIAAVAFLLVHLVYGLLAIIYQNKGNFLRFSPYFLSHLDRYLFRKNKEYTYTREYKRDFSKMLAIYFSVLPMYLPCILLTKTPTAMPIAIVVFGLPQIYFVIRETYDSFIYVKRRRQADMQYKKWLEEELKEQKKKEKMGKWR